MAQADLQTFSFHNTDGPKGWQGFSVEWQRGLIRGEAEGFWSLPMTEQHVAAWIKCIRRIHSEGRTVRVIADLSRAQTQSQEVASMVQRQVAGLYREGDRIAVIVKASLLKTQLRRVLNSHRAMYFTDADEGERWVLSD